MFDYTDRVKRIIKYSATEAKRYGSTVIDPEHLLLTMLKMGSGVAVEIINELGVSIEDLINEFEKNTDNTNIASIDIIKEPELSPRAKKVLSLAEKTAKEMGHNYVGTEHILLGIVEEKNGIASQILHKYAVTPEEIKRIIFEFFGDDSLFFLPPEMSPGPGGGMPPSGKKQKYAKKSKTPTLDNFATNLTAMARKGELDPVIGRDKQIERVIQILSRRKKNNPVLLGDPGVGKTAIVEGLAHKIIAGTVPEVLLDKKLLVLDLASIVAGTKYRGEFEQRLKRILDEMKGSRDVIIFIDEIHTLVGAGSAEGSIDAANILKPSLARGQIQCIGATTVNEYRKYIEKDAALERRFQTIMVEEPTEELTVEILKGLKERYETHHKVKIFDSALRAAAELSSRYIADRFLPDKAIDLIDEAAAKARLKITVHPPEIRDMEKQIEEIKKQKENSITNQDFEAAARLRDKEKSLKNQLKQLKDDWKSTKQAPDSAIGSEEIAQLVSDITGIPLFKLTEEETKKLLRIEEELKKRIIGQDEAIIAISKSVKRNRAGLNDPLRPVGSFLFLGPTGVGKTETARALAEFLFGSDEALIRLDMSEFMEKHSVSRLIGAPPGYVGYQEGGQLTEAVRRKPYSVILLDEIEKAHPDVFNILLQVLEDGRLTDHLGHSVNFRNTVVIMTSNIGTRDLFRGKNLGFAADDENLTYAKMKDQVIQEMKKIFSPEFLNRLDETIVFKALSKDSISKIIIKLVREVEDRLKKKKIHIELTKDAVDFLTGKGYNPQYGARPLKRAIQRFLEDPLTEEILAGKVSENAQVKVKKNADKLKFILKKIEKTE